MDSSLRFGGLLFQDNYGWGMECIYTCIHPRDEINISGWFSWMHYLPKSRITIYQKFQLRNPLALFSNRNSNIKPCSTLVQQTQARRRPKIEELTRKTKINSRTTHPRLGSKLKEISHMQLESQKKKIISMYQGRKRSFSSPFFCYF